MALDVVVVVWFQNFFFWKLVKCLEFVTERGYIKHTLRNLLLLNVENLIFSKWPIDNFFDFLLIKSILKFDTCFFVSVLSLEENYIPTY